METTVLDRTLKSHFQELHCAVTGSRFLSNNKFFFTFCARGYILLFNRRNAFLHCDKSCVVRINILPLTHSRRAVLWPIELALNSERGEL